MSSTIQFDIKVFKATLLALVYSLGHIYLQDYNKAMRLWIYMTGLVIFFFSAVLVTIFTRQYIMLGITFVALWSAGFVLYGWSIFDASKIAKRKFRPHDNISSG